MVSFRERIGIDVGHRLKLEDAIEWAAAHEVRFIDIQLDTDENAFTRFDDVRARAVREACRRHGVRLGLHTLSAVNIAEYSPHVADGVDRYLDGYIDLAPKLGAGWIVVHAGYHFTADRTWRMEAGLDRLRRAAARAERVGTVLLLENLNKEPVDAEVHYLAHTVEEWRFYWERLASPALRLTFTANHAHLVPEGIEGFVDALDWSRVAEVRLADCFRNGREQHLKPGDGDLDFADLFRRVEAKGFSGPYTLAFGTLDDMLKGRDDLLEAARTAGVA